MNSPTNSIFDHYALSIPTYLLIIDNIKTTVSILLKTWTCPVESMHTVKHILGMKKGQT